MHFDGFNISGNFRWSESNIGSWFKDTGFDSSDWDCSNTSNFVYILQWKSQSFISWSGWWGNFIQCFLEGDTWIFWFVIIIPTQIRRFFNHVISLETGDRNERNIINFITDFFKIGWQFFLDFIISSFREFWFSGIHFVDSDNHLFDSESEGQETMFSSLSVSWDTGFKFSCWGSNHEYGAISLRCSGNHIFDEIFVSWSINNGENENISNEFPESNIDGNTSFSFSFKFI